MPFGRSGLYEGYYGRSMAVGGLHPLFSTISVTPLRTVWARLSGQTPFILLIHGTVKVDMSGLIMWKTGNVWNVWTWHHMKVVYTLKSQMRGSVIIKFVWLDTLIDYCFICLLVWSQNSPFSPWIVVHVKLTYPYYFKLQWKYLGGKVLYLETLLTFYFLLAF